MHKSRNDCDTEDFVSKLIKYSTSTRSWTQWLDPVLERPLLPSAQKVYPNHLATVSKSFGQTTHLFYIHCCDITQPDKLHQEVLSVDLEDRDDLYRIRRGRRIVYFSTLDPSIIPWEDKTNYHRFTAETAIWCNSRDRGSFNQIGFFMLKKGKQLRCKSRSDVAEIAVNNMRQSFEPRKR